MKLSTKPLSSPGRTEKFPPPLMRFLRSNVGSKSRGRSRASPMFVRKKSTAIETQEPSSPKVTCMGQVRVRRSKQNAARPGRPAKGRCCGCHCRCRWCWVQNAFFCCHRCTCRTKPKSFKLPFRKWGWCFQVGFQRKVETREPSSKPGSKIKTETVERESEEDEESEKETKVYASNSCSPPKNALLLMRSRSAPYRSSSLASQFWGSPLQTDEAAEEELRKTDEFDNGEEHDENEKPASENESICKDSDPETEKHSVVAKETEGPIQRRFVKSANIEEISRAEEVGSIRPLILTRCKSEPARTSQKFNPEIDSGRREGWDSTLRLRHVTCDYFN